MFNRKIYSELLKWKNDKYHKALLVKGARQIGKTFIIREFGKKEYKSFISINFLENNQYSLIFDGSLEPEDIYKGISARVDGVKFIEHETLIFFDEIQECPNARTALKFLTEDGKYDFIASGSLLGIKYKEQDEKTFSVPVGYEKDIEMYSLDFEEFLWAKGVNIDTIDYLKTFFEKKQSLPYDLIEKFNGYFKEYMAIGGMPEVVKVFLSTNNYQEANNKQKEIIKNYHDDIIRYSTTAMKQKISSCYNSIPAQLSKEYTKFQYGKVESKATSKKYETSIDWLCDAGMAKRCNNVSTPLFPLKGYEVNTDFKLYITDIGLLTNMFGFETQSAIVTDNLKSPAKGGIYENAIYVELIKRHENVNYYKRKDNQQEIEFLIEKNAEVIPIEVKSKNGTTISLNNYINVFSPQIAYKIIDGNLGVINTKNTIPLFMTMFI